MATPSLPIFCVFCHEVISRHPPFKGRLRDLTGQVFHRLTAQHYAYTNSKTGQAFWCCTCSCGGMAIVARSRLLAGNTRSCGCLHKEIVAQICLERSRTHGFSNTPSYMRWKGLIARCTNPKNPSYQHYGGRGITVCAQWLSSYETFARDMGEPPPKKYLERRDNNGPYSPENCYWATGTEQANNKRNNRLLTYDGMTCTLAEWARRTGIPIGRIAKRLSLGWDVSRTLTLPKDKRFKH